MAATERDLCSEDSLSEEIERLRMILNRVAGDGHDLRDSGELRKLSDELDRLIVLFMARFPRCVSRSDVG
ncbi:MAG: aspartyl-phosphate phosphatase Spo0E family protein [Bacillota bacterium]